MIDNNGDFSFKIKGVQTQKGQNSSNGIKKADQDKRMSMNGSIFAPSRGGGATE